MMKTVSRTFPLCALVLASCGGSPSGGTGTAGTGAGSAGTSGAAGSGSGGATTGSAGTTGGAGTTGSAGAPGAGGSIGTGAAGTTGSAGSGSGGSATGSGGSAGTTGSGGSAGAGAGGSSAGTGGAAGGRGGTGGSAGAGAGGSSAGTGGSATCAPPTATPPSGNDAVVGTMIQFNDNGGWCWYQDERAVVDTKANKLLIASTASGGSRNGQAEAVIYDLATSTGKRYTLPSSLVASTVDDHNAPAVLVRPDGKYVAMWSGHRSDCYSRVSIFDGSAWGSEKKIDWAPWGCPWPGADTNMVTYSNPWYIGTTIFAGVRSVGTSPAFLSSTDDGVSWSYYGRLTTTPQMGYVAGYYKFWGDNTGRIDFTGTEAHPRDVDNSLWHGYIQNGKVYNSLGTEIDTSLKDSSSSTSNAKDISAYTQVFKTGSTIKGVQLNHAWNHDIVRYADGTVAILWQARVAGTGTDDPDKRHLYARFDGTSWKLTYLVKSGTKLYNDEQDYTGLAALDPDDPHTIYVSTPYDPRDDTTKSSKREIWRGTTCDNGATFTWTPVTARSTMDNIRPIVPKWDSSHTALLWLRGTYTTAQNYAMKVVGTLSAK